MIDPDKDLVVRAGESLTIEARGPERQDAAGQLLLCRGSQIIVEEGAEVKCEGILQVEVELAHERGPAGPPGQGGSDRYRVDFEFTVVTLLEVVGNQAIFESEERQIAVQCLTWVFERAYRRLKLRTLGGRGWYCTGGPDEDGMLQPEDFPRGREAWNRQRQREPPRVRLYRGFAPSLVSVQHGPCFKIDLSTRLVQAANVLEKYQTLWQVFDADVRQGRAVGTWEDVLERHFRGRVCITDYNHQHYRIERVCTAKSPSDTFPYQGATITFQDYYWTRYGTWLEEQQPLLHCPTKRNQELYLPAQVAKLTGQDKEWRHDKAFCQSLWSAFSKKPDEHWRMQSLLVQKLQPGQEGHQPLEEWGMTVPPRALEMECLHLRDARVYYDPATRQALEAGQQPAAWEGVSSQAQRGFERPPVDKVWTSEEHIDLERWVVFYDQRQAAVVREFTRLMVAHGRAMDRVQIADPQLVPWDRQQRLRQLQAYRPPWRHMGETAFVLVVLPSDEADSNFYFRLKRALTLQETTGVPSQMILTSTLQQERARRNIMQNILLQVLVKRGGWLWVFRPLPNRERIVMVAGVDARSAPDRRSIQALSASTDILYHARYFTTWATRDAVRRGPDYDASPLPLLVEALTQFVRTNGMLPDQLLLYRGGISESQEAALMESAGAELASGRLQQELSEKAEVRQARNFEGWSERFEIAFIVVRRRTQTRFCMPGRQYNNVASGTVVTEGAVPDRGPGSEQWDFYMVSQHCLIGTARPALYSVLFQSRGFSTSREELIELTYRLCGLYFTYAGHISVPAPLKYATKLLQLLCGMEDYPQQPPQGFSEMQKLLFFV